MSERTTIGGTVYESIGSSSSNLLLKCNGTARIQWGNRLIDLIKNGKIASGDSSTQIYVISDESEIKSDGVYVLSKEESLQLLICKDDEQYNITNTDLYISAKTKQDITVDQRQQALENIGMYYNTLEEVQQAGIQNGLVYVLSDQNLYTVKDGVVTEFEAKLKTVTVEKEQQEGEVIKSNVNIVLSVLDTDYMIVGKGQILINYPLRIKESASIESENASSDRGYRLYIDSAGSHLDIDYINVRTGIPINEYIEITYEDFYTYLSNANLQPHKWYLITDYQNPWKLVIENSEDRPILVRALTSSTIYSEGKLFIDQRVIITYDPHYRKLVSVLNSDNQVITRGLITTMKDSKNNQANFDFLNYGIEEDPEIIVHSSEDSDDLDSSIFPLGSYNNNLIVYDLKNSVINSDGTLGGNSRINFKYSPPTSFESTEEEVIDDGDDSEDIAWSPMQLHDNVIKCHGIILEATCDNFCNNVIEDISDTIPISTNIINSSFGSISGNSELLCNFKNVKFQNIINCKFNTDSTKTDADTIQDVTAYSDLSDITIDIITYPFLYDVSKSKEVVMTKPPEGESKLSITIKKEQTFFRGMIVMHSGLVPIPEGWAICDGNPRDYNGEIGIPVPNLIGNFIKAVGEGQCGPGGSSEITISVENLPSHTHTYEILVEDSKNINIHEGDDVLTTSIPQYTTKSTQTGATGSGKAITIDPKHYGLIFIMKL